MGDEAATERTLRALGGALLIWRPYLPEPRPAIRWDPSGPEPVALAVLQHARELCSSFRVPPRQFRRRVRKGTVGYYQPETDIVAVDPASADMESMGGDDGYYACLLHELLHATGHPRRLARATTGNYSTYGNALEEGTVTQAQRIVLAEIGFDGEALDWHAPRHGLPVDRFAARQAASWVLETAAVSCGAIIGSLRARRS